MTRWIAILATAVLVATLGVMAYKGFGPKDVAGCGGGVTIAGGDIGGPFTLVDETGTTVTDADVFTKPTLLYFGYTFCPDVCPLDSARNAEALTLLQERGIDAQAAFITVDPKRDTVEEVAAFTDLFHPDMIGLTGSPEQTDAASKAYKTYYKINDEDDPEFYLVDHSTFTYLVLPESGFKTFYRRENTPEEIADTAACFIEAS